MGCRSVLTAAAGALVLAAAAPRPAAAQLISPGKLSEAHVDLEGVRNCTKCHRLRERGVANDLCLACHTPEQTRIAKGTGYHATLGDRSCSDCHKEHFGRDFDVLHLDTAAFDHQETGFTLEERHTELECRKCHQPELIVAADVRAFKGEHGTLDRTFLGLGTTCEACHESDSPHGKQFADRACTDCHTQRDWKHTRGFDHDDTRYALTGEHRDVACEKCHKLARPGDAKSRRYTGIAFRACTDSAAAPRPVRAGVRSREDQVRAARQAPRRALCVVPRAGCGRRGGDPPHLRGHDGAPLLSAARRHAVRVVPSRLPRGRVRRVAKRDRVPQLPHRGCLAADQL
ncbi:MAG: hypothetical protein AMS20_17205 [Gemmatimonas sp. SG8_28]|nr:MAG: hypothetical protein AMS20_17205 [Gemmatimonas sp. SG8_28]